MGEVCQLCGEPNHWCKCTQSTHELSKINKSLEVLAARITVLGNKIEDQECYANGTTEEVHEMWKWKDKELIDELSRPVLCGTSGFQRCVERVALARILKFHQKGK